MTQYTLDAVLSSAAQKSLSSFNIYLVLVITLRATYAPELLQQGAGSRLKEQMSDKWASGFTASLSVIWRDRTGALLPLIQFLRFFLRRTGPHSQQTTGCNEPCQFIPAEDLAQNTLDEQVCATGVVFLTLLEEFV